MAVWRWAISPDSSVTSPARRSVPWAVRPDVANSSPAASATTGTRTVQPEGRRPRNGKRATGTSSHVPVGTWDPTDAHRRRRSCQGSSGGVVPELRLGCRYGRSDGPVPGGRTQVAQVQGAQEVGLHAAGGGAAVPRRTGPRRPAEPSLVRRPDGHPH